MLLDLACLHSGNHHQSYSRAKAYEQRNLCWGMALSCMSYSAVFCDTADFLTIDELRTIALYTLHFMQYFALYRCDYKDVCWCGQVLV